MRWMKLAEGNYVNLDLATNIELTLETDFSSLVEPGEARPRRSVLRIYFDTEVDGQQSSIPVYNREVMDEIIGMMETMSHDTLKNFQPKRGRSPGIKHKGPPLSTDEADGLQEVAVTRIGRGH